MQLEPAHQKMKKITFIKLANFMAEGVQISLPVHDEVRGIEEHFWCLGTGWSVWFNVIHKISISRSSGATELQW